MKKDTLIKDYLSQRKQELEEKDSKNQEKNKSSAKWTISALLAMVIIIGGTFGADKLITNIRRSSFLSETDKVNMSEVAPDVLDDAKAYALFEEKTLGNTNNNLINYGYYASHNDLESYIESEKGALLLVKGKDMKQITDHSVKYINITDDAIYFRDDSDRKIYRSALNGENISKVMDIKTGQFLVSGDYVYYINFEDENKLYSYNLSDETNEALNEDKVSSFVKIGSEFIYLDSENTLKKCNQSGNSTVIQSNIEKFYYNGKIIAQNNGNIITFTLDGKNPKNIISDDVELVGADENNIYYAKGSEIYRYDISGTEKLITDGCDFYKGVFKFDGGYYIVGSVKNEENNTYKDKIITLNGD